MTPRQKRILGGLVVANVACLILLLLSVTRFSGSVSPLGLPSPVPTYRPGAQLSPACQRRAVRMLSQAGLGGTVTLNDQALQFDLVHHVHVTDDAHTEGLAQRVWTAFDIALALVDVDCDTFSRVEIMIESQGAPKLTRVYAAVDASDLQAFGSGALSERAFIDQVHYQSESIDDDDR